MSPASKPCELVRELGVANQQTSEPRKLGRPGKPYVTPMNNDGNSVVEPHFFRGSPMWFAEVCQGPVDLLVHHFTSLSSK